MGEDYTKRAIIKQVDKFYEMVKEANDFEKVKEVYWYLEMEINELKKDKFKSNPSDIRLGIEQFDSKIGSFNNGDLIVLAGLPSTGKTLIACDMIYHNITKFNKKGLLFSIEIPKEQIIKRFELDGKDIEPLINNLIINDTSAICVEDIVDESTRLKEEKGIDFIVIDYLNLVYSTDDLMKNSRMREYLITKKLNELAKKLNVPIIVLSLLGRTVLRRKDKKPVLDDLCHWIKGDAFIEQIIFVHGWNLFTDDEPFKDSLELIIAKNRFGPTGSIKLTKDNCELVKRLSKYRNYKV